MRRWLSRLSPVACCLSPAFAQAQEAVRKGMPQLDFANPLTISQIVWLVVIFGALYALLSSWALPKVETVIADRRARIGADLNSARAAKNEADAAARDMRETTSRARAEAQAEINAAVDAAKRAAAERAAVLDQALDARLAEAEQRIGAARRDAMAGLHEIAAEVATAMIARLSGQPAAPPAVDAAVSALLAQRAA